jgi:hypothetical protein
MRNFFVALGLSIWFADSSIAQNELIELVNQRAKAYSLEAEFALPEYQMLVDMEVESSPDSALLFSSKAKMELVQTKIGTFKRCDINPKIFADDRVGARNGKGGVMDFGPFARIERWERVVVDKRVFDLIDNSRVPIPKTTPLRPVHEVMLRLSTNCIKPFDWPIHGPGGFDSSAEERDSYKIVFGRERICIFATQTEGNRLESHWSKEGVKIGAVHRILFQDDLPVLSEIFVLRGEDEAQRYDLKNAMKLIRTETTWQEVGEARVPRTVVSDIRGFGRDRRLLVVMAKFQFFKPGDESFEKRKAEIGELVDRVRRDNKDER